MRAKILIAMLLLLAIPAIAHERQVIEINNIPYTIVIGSQNEPLYVGDKTGLDFRVSLQDGTPVEALEKTLKLEVSDGTKKLQQDIRAAHGQPGAYKTTLYLTEPITLQYRIFGTIDNTPVNLQFECAHGHGKGPDSNERVKLGENVYRTFKAGGYSCPELKNAVTFPTTNKNMATGAHSTMVHEMIHVDSRWQTTTALILSALALLIAILSLHVGRRKVESA